MGSFAPDTLAATTVINLTSLFIPPTHFSPHKCNIYLGDNCKIGKTH